MSDRPSAGRRPTISHVVDCQRRYPGEDVTFCTRVQVPESAEHFTLRIALPEGLSPGQTQAPGGAVPDLSVSTEGRYLIWDVEPLPGNDVYEYQVAGRVLPTEQDRVLRCRATLTVQGADGDRATVSETSTVAVSAKGHYLRYLPGLYHRDDLMGRLLMLFESFWTPIEGRIERLPLYFDPQMTPADLLPWLASWLGVVLDARWSDSQRRRLICSAASLFRRRGTRQSLLEYLEILGEKAEIIEHRANNFRLGPEARLGPGIALGTENVPHTFTVLLQVTEDAALPLDSPAFPGGVEGARSLTERLEMVKAIIEAEKPAHTRYTLRTKTDQSASRAEG